MSEREYDGTGTGHEPYGQPAYRGPGQRGDEVADALTAELAAEYAADEPAADHIRSHRDPDDPHSGLVGRLVEDDGGSISHTDSDVLASYADPDGDLRELSAEEAGMHFIDPEDDPIPE